MQRLLESSGVSAEDFYGKALGEGYSDSPWVSDTTLQWADILYKAEALSGDSAIALRFGDFLSPDTLGPLGYAFLSSENIKAAVSLLIKYWPIISDEVELHTEERPEALAIVIRSQIAEPRKRVLFIETIISGIISFARMLTNNSIDNMVLALDYAPPSYAKQYDKQLRALSTFLSDQCRVEVPNDLLRQKINTSNRYAQAVLKYQCEMIAANFYAHYTESARVRWHLVESRLLNASIAGVAKALSMSERTLRRKLQSENTSFSVLKDEVSCALAEEYLRSTEFSLEDIALLVGYSERNSFKRAFRRWKGISPKEFREQHK
jgi:AraC-like DNA-binding protein